MPVYQCPGGKWKIGKNGECKFQSKEKAENAFRHWVISKQHIDFYDWLLTEEGKQFDEKDNN